MPKKELILPQSSLLILSKLTIGYSYMISWWPYDSYGFSTKGGPGIPNADMGALNPSLGYEALKVTVEKDPRSVNIYATRPFLYNGRLYGEGLSTEEEILALFNEWKNLNGKTVDVYLSPA